MAAKRKLRVGPAAGIALGVLALLVGLYVAGHFAAGDQLPKQATVSGVKLGGLSLVEAERTLREELGPRAERDLTISAMGKSIQVQPGEAGLAVDYPASVAAAGGGRSWNPLTIAEVLFGGAEHRAVLKVNQDKLAETVAALADRVDLPAVNAEVKYEGLKPVRTPGAAGTAIDQAAGAKAVTDAFLYQTQVDLPVTRLEPEVTTAEADEVAAGLAATAVAAPISVKVATSGTIVLQPAQLASALGFKASGGRLVAEFNISRLQDSLAPALGKLGLKQPKDATITIRNGKPHIVAEVDGTGVDPAQLATALSGVLASPAPRSIEVPLSSRKASFTTADAEALKVKEVTGRFTTYFPGSTYRYNNIGKAAKLITGTFLKPGEVFSMNKTLGERTRAAGWMAGGAIDGGQIVERMGGGISQATTTTFNAIFFAGLEDIYHKPHSLYFSRYPVGREATLDWSSVDMKFRNDSPYGVVMHAWITGRPGRTGSITVQVWSTKRYTIKSSTPIRYNYRSPGKKIYDTSKDCVPQSAMSGFDVRFKRLFYQGKKLVRSEPFKWSYHTLTPVVCGKKPRS